MNAITSLIPLRVPGHDLDRFTYMTVIPNNAPVLPLEKSSTVGGRLGQIETRLAKSAFEIEAAQRVRYRVFCEELSAKTGAVTNLAGLDQDEHDQKCDHLLVIDRSGASKETIIGTQRFLTQNGSDNANNYYSAREFDIAPLLANHPSKKFMELGRSCILADYRSKRTMELMWHGTWDYALKHSVDVMFGCASFPVTEINLVASELKFLREANTATGNWSVR